MTENLLQKLEEKMMSLFSELEEARKEIVRLNHENLSLNIEKEKYTKKIQDLLSLLDDAADMTETVVMNVGAPLKPVLVQN